MKNLFELSEEEKNNIRGLHESYKDKPGTSLNEQGARVSGVKYTPGNIDINRTKTKETDTITGQEGKGEEDYFTPEDNQEVLKYYAQGKDWTENINLYIKDKIKWWDVSSNNAFKKIMKDSPYIMFNVVAEIGRKDGDSTAIKAQRVVIEDLGEKTITEPGTPGEPGKIDYLTFPYPATPGLTSDFFPNNSWIPTKEFANYVQTQIVDPIKSVYEEAMSETKQKPTMFLQYMNVESSVSKFRNTITNSGEPIQPGTENPDRMSFETLANKRANASIQYIKNALSPYINVEDSMSWSPSVITINDKGTNGDGSSGPDPYKEAQKLIDKKVYPNMTAAFEDKNFTASYRNYRYTKLNFSIGVIPIDVKKETKPVPPEPGKTINKNNYKFLFFYKDTDWNFTFKLPSLTLKYTSSAKKIGPFKVDRTDCNVSWWERITGKFFNPGSKGF